MQKNNPDLREIRFEDNVAYEREKAIYHAAQGLVPELLGCDDAAQTLYVQRIDGKTVQELVSEERDRYEQHAMLFACLDDLLKFQERIKDVPLPAWDQEKYVRGALDNFQWLKENWDPDKALVGLLKEVYARISEILTYNGPITLNKTHGEYYARNVVVRDNQRYLMNFENTAQNPVMPEIIKLSYYPCLKVAASVRAHVFRRAPFLKSWEENRFFFVAERLCWARQFAELAARQGVSTEECKNAEKYMYATTSEFYSLLPSEDP